MVLYTQVTLEPSSFTNEKFALYRSYQRNIHHEEEKMASSFRNFLVDTPLLVSITTTCPSSTACIEHK